MAFILLIRHGQNDWVKKGRLAGWTPGVHLDETGREQAAALGERLAHLPIAAVYSSPLERCRETAAAVAEGHGLAIAELPEVGEVRYGKWQGKKIKKLAKKRKWYGVQHFPSRFAFPKGESFTAVQHRAVGALERLSREHEKEIIAVVSHADVIKLVLAHYLGVHMDLFQRIVVAPASVSVVAMFKNGHVRVLRINDDGPIQAPKLPKEEAAAEGQAAADASADSTEAAAEKQ